jgi:hypothetical protein
MDQAADKIAPETQIRPDPVTDLVRNMTPDTSAKLKAFLLPPREGILFGIGPMVYRVGYINQGALKFSSEFYGLRTTDGIMRPGGQIEKQGEKLTENVKEASGEVQGSTIADLGIG